MVESTVHTDCESRDILVATRINEREILESREFHATLLDVIANTIAKEIIKYHLPEILEKISPEAIANMTIASAGAKINETLSKKIPDKILHAETTRTEIYKSGLFGGLKRIV